MQIVTEVEGRERDRDFYRGGEAENDPVKSALGEFGVSLHAVGGVK